MALPPNSDLHLKNEGGRHYSLICELKAEEVDRWLPPRFVWTDRHFEACLDVTSPGLRPIMLRLSRELRYPVESTPSICDALLTQLGIDLARFLVAIEEPVERGGLADWRLKIIDERVSRFGSSPTLRQLAELCGMSARQLSRAFRVSRGCSVGEYIRQTRIEDAKRLLASGQGIKTIAAAAGFSSQSTFTSAFRTATGMTPRHFRERMAERKDSG